MALRMVALNRASDGRWFARKGIPEDLREAYARLYGMRREAHLKLPGDTPRHEAKVRLGEWEAEVETRIATLRAQRNGEGQLLTRINAIALAGTIKTRQTRVVPLHEHVIAQGFLQMVREVGKGPLFYNEKEEETEGDALKPSRSRAGNTRGRLAEWVREQGVTDKELSPTHAWLMARPERDGAARRKPLYLQRNFLSRRKS